MLDKLVDGIYNNCIETIISKLDSYQEQARIEYRNYLYRAYKLVQINNNLEIMIDICSDMELGKWNRATSDSILSGIIEDQNLNNIMQISSIAYKHAQRKMVAVLNNQEYIPELTEEQVKRYIEEMEKYKEQVYPFNTTRAEMFLSEGILDLKYSVNLIEETSLRVGRLR